MIIPFRVVVNQDCVGTLQFISDVCPNADDHKGLAWEQSDPTS